MKSLYLFICTAILIITKQVCCQSLKYDNDIDNNISMNYQSSDTDTDMSNNESDNSEAAISSSDKYLNNFIKRLLMKTSKSLLNHQLINKLSNTTTSTLSLIKHSKRLTNENKDTRDPDRVTRNEDFLGSRGRRQFDNGNVQIDYEKKFSNDFLGSRGKKYEEFLGSRGRRHDEEFMGSRGRRVNKDDDRDHSINRRINEEFLGSRGRRMDDFLGSRGKRYDEFYGSRGRRQSYLTSIDCRHTNYCDDNVLLPKNDNNFLLNGYDNYLKQQHLHHQLINDEKSMTMLINKKSNKNNQETRVDTQIVREPFWAHRGKKDNYHRHHVNNIWHNDNLFADEPYWILVIDDQITTTRRTKNNNELPLSPLVIDGGPSSTDFTVLNNENPFILSRG